MFAGVQIQGGFIPPKMLTHPPINLCSHLGPDWNSGMSYLHHVPPSVPWLDHVHPSGLQFPDCITCSPPVHRLHQLSSATLQLPGCITCSPQVPRLYHVLPFSSQNLSRPPPPPHILFGDTCRGKFSLFSPFVTFIDFTLSTAISA